MCANRIGGANRTVTLAVIGNGSIREEMDTAYLKSTVGEALAQGLTAVAVNQPDDAVDYLGNFLLQYVQKKQIEAKVWRF